MSQRLVCHVDEPFRQTSRLHDGAGEHEAGYRRQRQGFEAGIHGLREEGQIRRSEAHRDGHHAESERDTNGHAYTEEYDCHHCQY